jgi:hypothetical protein
MIALAADGCQRLFGRLDAGLLSKKLLLHVAQLFLRR